MFTIQGGPSCTLSPEHPLPGGGVAVGVFSGTEITQSPTLPRPRPPQQTLHKLQLLAKRAVGTLLPVNFQGFLRSNLSPSLKYNPICLFPYFEFATLKTLSKSKNKPGKVTQRYDEKAKEIILSQGCILNHLVTAAGWEHKSTFF